VNKSLENPLKGELVTPSGHTKPVRALQCDMIVASAGKGKELTKGLRNAESGLRIENEALLKSAIRIQHSAIIIDRAERSGV
jgi:hypothetical protein